MNQQTKVGIFAFLTILIFIFGFYFLKGTNLFATKNRYFAKYDRIDGLYKSNPVVINGFRIGTISDMQIDPNSGKIIVEIIAEDDFQIPSNSTAAIKSMDLVGSKVVNVTLGNSKTFLKSGDTLQTSFKEDLTEALGNAITPLMAKLTKTITSLDTVVGSLKMAFDKQDPSSTISRLNTSLANISGMTADLATTLHSGKLDGSLNNIESFTKNLENNNQKIDKILSNLQTFTDTLKEVDIKQTVDNAKIALNEIKILVDGINNGDGTITKLIKDKQMYTNLEAATSNLDKLLVDVKDNPYRYVNVSLFGGQKRDEKYKLKMEKKKLKEQAASQPK